MKMIKPLMLTGVLLYALSAHSQIAQMIAQKRFDNQRAKLISEFPNMVPENDPKYQKNEGITSPYHQDHIGQIVFSKTAIDRGISSDAGLTSTFNYGDDIHTRIFLKSSLQNYYCYPSNSNTPDDTRENRFLFYVFIDGVKGIGDLIEVNLNGDEYNPKTSIGFPLYGLSKLNKEEPNERLAKALNQLKTGSHKIRIELFAYGYSSTFKPVASGEFTILKKEGDVLKTGKKFAALRKKTDPEFEKLALKLINHEQATEKRIYEQIAIQSKDWDVIRNNNTGVVTARSVTVYAYYKDEGMCYYDQFFLIQDFDGTAFQKSIYTQEAWRTRRMDIDCD
jgi:hypothetical protein